MDGTVLEGVPSAPSSLLGFVSLFVTKFASPSRPTLTQQPTCRHSSFEQRKQTRERLRLLGQSAFSAEEVQQHNTPEDCWIVVDGKVHDVSGFDHPGGDVVFSYAGQDASEVFATMHKSQVVARKLLKAYCIGELVGANQAPLLKDFHAMKQSFAEQGLLDANPIYYTRKCLELVGMVGTSLYLLFAYSSSLPALLASSLLMAIFIFQCGWACHDFHHNQIFKRVFPNELVGAIILNIGMGGSTHWWKTKHNQHHATPNKMTENNQATDPDIDTVPLIAWSENLMKQVQASGRSIIIIQHIVMWPLLFVAYINWLYKSVGHLMYQPAISTKQRRIEIGAIAFHHVWLNACIFGALGFTWQAAAYWMIAHTISGFLTSFIFVQSHNGMEIYTDDKDFVTAQLVSTRNIHPGLFMDWFCGGLNYQIEHHLIPTMPRHSFSRARPRIMELCARHGLPYESCSLTESTIKVYKTLAHVGHAAKSA
ncbi:delta 6 desaturase [Dunaliella salina]|uniref:Delta 6 desaturase n=1 Tax=Dunaliella salina TaxID=3046 RepID=A0ABQ7GM86_DUNSA|nr:delta 6 desaturase [Dunaliella salina]|eukprot:KAF5835722.1 delta 6 desaturase [Dunaliella salina]